jgi:alpha-beta hydrolase superfamily lysophospholipase
MDGDTRRQQRLRPWSTLSRGVAAAAVAVLLAWGLLVGAVWFGQERLLFEPEPLAATALPVLPDLTQEWIDVPGARLHAIRFRQPLVGGVRSTRGLLFYLHGNTGNVATYFVDPAFWHDSGYDLFLLDYRGFGRSTGKIEGEAQLHADVLAAWRYVARDYDGLRKVILGRSLGTGLAVPLAAAVRPDLLVLVSPYSSMTAVKDVHYPWVPDAALRYPLASDRLIGDYDGPTLIFHGLRDAVIPAEESKALAREARRAELVLLPDADHVNVHELPLYRDTLLARLRGL